MTVDAGVIIQSNVSKHLKWRKSQTALQTSAAGSSGAVAGQETVRVHVGTTRARTALTQGPRPELPLLLLGLQGQGVWLQQHLCIYFQGRQNLWKV